MAGRPAKTKLSPKLEARKGRLLQLLHDLKTLRLCGPSDDPDEQTSVIEFYRYLLINLKVGSAGLVSFQTKQQLDELKPEAIETIYDIYPSRAYLDAIATDIEHDLENITEVPSGPHLISPDLIKALREAKPNTFDASRLAEYCHEINSGFAHGNLISCLLLMRAVLNHVPPIFGHTDFSQVVANVGRSLKDNFEHLDEGLRKIGDLYTHQHMRKKDHLPTPGQVEKFGPQFELLLQEVLTRLQT
jgi:predicted transcriptional regulator with HTH domain